MWKSAQSSKNLVTFLSTNNDTHFAQFSHLCDILFAGNLLIYFVLRLFTGT